MNDNTTKLIEQLAAKLGTTSEYLWNILLQQAPVSATITLIHIVIVVAAGVGLYKIHRYLLNDDNDINYDDNFESGMFMGIVSIIWLVAMTMALVAGLPKVINGYFNPEFWALDYILGKLK